MENNLIAVLNNLNSAIKNNEQEMINIFAKEIVDTIYIPFNAKISYEEMLIEYGYKPINMKEEVQKRHTQMLEEKENYENKKLIKEIKK